MPKLISANFMKNEAHCLNTMFKSVKPYVKENYVLIDDASIDNTEELCKLQTPHVKRFKFENFGKTQNTMLKYVSGKSDWVLVIAPDEVITPDFGENVLKLINKIQDTDIDFVWFCRRHWEDLEMQKEYTKQNWYPDWQMRLFRNSYPRIHYIHYVHEWPIGARKELRIQADIHHFNMYWKPRIDYNFDRMNALYNELKAKQQYDGGKDIWPNE